MVKPRAVRKRSLKDAEGPGAAPAKGKHKDREEKVDPASVFIRGLPKGTADNSLRTWLETRVGPTVTCFVIRDDYGLVKFKEAADAHRCLEELQGVEFEGSALKLQVAKPKRQRAQRPGPPVPAVPPAAAATPAAASSSSTAAGDEGGKAAQQKAPAKVDLRVVQLSGLPKDIKKEALQSWIEQKLPGGCGIEHIQRILREASSTDKQEREISRGTFLVHFRKDLNARRALEALDGLELQGHTIAAAFRALELSRTAAKASRLIVRNLSFSATEKHVRKAFEQLGPVTEVNVPTKDGATGKMNRGFAFVQLQDMAMAERAVAELNGSKICGRGVAVDFAVNAELYKGLQHQERQEPPRQPKAAVEAVKGKSGSVPGDLEEEEEEEEEEDGEEAEEEDEEEAEEGQEEAREGADTGAEVKRMKGLIGDGEDNEDEGEEDPEATAKAKSKKDLRKPGFDVDDKCTVFVRNIAFDAGEEDLREVLRRFGKIVRVKLVTDSSGEHKHRGSAFVKFAEAAGAAAALAEEAEADKKLKELGAVVRKSDRRELPAVEGFGISLKGRRLVLKEAVTPKEAETIVDSKKKKKGAALEEKVRWKYLLNVGDILQGSDKWQQMSKSEQLQRMASAKERKWRISNPNYTIHPMRLSIRNLAVKVDATKLRQVVVRYLSTLDDLEGIPKGAKRKERRMAAEKLVVKASLCRNADKRDSENSRRSRGFGFMELKNHDTAMRVLEYLNDNPKAFGGTKRPIVQFTIEDKRKLRMQQELYKKHAHKLLKGKVLGENEEGGEAAEGKDGKANVKAGGKADGKGGGKSTDGAKGDGKGKDGSKDAAAEDDWKKKRKHKKKPGESRGRRQREKRRQQKIEAAEREQAKALVQAEKEKRRTKRLEEIQIQRQRRPKPRSSIPDSQASVEGRKRKQEWELNDDFELKAMDKFRRNM